MLTLFLPPELDTGLIDFDNLTSAESSADIIVTQNENGQLTLSHQSVSFCLDLTIGNYRHRQQNIGKEPLLNALKIKGKLPNRVLDTTPGVLKDAWMLAGRGINVLACERHPVIALLQYHALKYAEQNECCRLMARDLSLQFTDSKSILTAEFLDSNKIDSIYLDPMYPHSPNSASVKKDLRLLQNIVGDDIDSSELLERALFAAKQSDKVVRVVVKRPPYAEPLAKIKPNYESKTGKTRFDVYF